MPDHDQRRAAMVENQLRPSRIDDPRVLAAMGAVPRELFVPRHLRGAAYGDEDLDLGDGRRLIEPLALGKLLQAGVPRAEDVALVIGCDTGYCAAVLTRLVATVFALAEDPSAAERIETALAAVGADTAIVAVGGARAGLAAQGPFDLIVVAGAIDAAEPEWLNQLSDRGRLVAVRREGRAGRVTVWTRVGEGFGTSEPFDAMIPPLRGMLAAPSFVF